MSGFLDLAQTLSAALKSLQMYTAAHPRTRQAAEAAHRSVTGILAGQERLQFVASAGKAFVDGQVFETKAPQVAALVKLVSERGLNGFRFDRGVTPEEFLEFLQILALKPDQIEAQGGFEALLLARDVRNIHASQTRYEVVREGEGDGGEGQEERPPAFIPPAQVALPSPPPDSLVRMIREALLAALAKGGAGVSAEGGLPGFGPADLEGLGPVGYQLGLAEGMPTPVQMGTLRQVLMSLSPEMQFSLLAGLPTLPKKPEGLGLGVRALAGEMLAVATSSMLGKGFGWEDLRGPLEGILRPLQDRADLVGTLAKHLRSIGQDASVPEGILRFLDWEQLSLEARLLMVLEEGYLFDMTLDQRLAFLRELLDLKRFDAFVRVQEILLEVLRSDLSPLRMKSVQTLTGIARWGLEPGLPLEIEGPLSEALRAHFDWEPEPPIHRWCEEALGALFVALVKRGDLGHTLMDYSEIQGLCEFQGNPAPWRREALVRLRTSLEAPALLEAAVAQIFRRDRDELMTEVYPYFGFLGDPLARHLVLRLGEERDRARRGRLVEALRVLGPAALPSLLEALGAQAWYLVRNALTLLGDLGNAECVPALPPLLRHPEPRVRRAAIRALWKLGGAASEPHLLERLPEEEPETQQEILFALGQLRSEAALPAVSELAGDRRRTERIRLMALDTLAHIASPKSLPFLAELLRRKGFFASAESFSVRQSAARALAALGSPEARATLARIVEAEPKGYERDALARLVAP